MAVRDRNWGTIPARLANERIEVAESVVSYQLRGRSPAERDRFLPGVARSSARATARFCFAMEGEARTTFSRNRIGFCVLYQPRLRGGGLPDRACRWRGRGPAPFLAISRHNMLWTDKSTRTIPSPEMRAFAHEVMPGAWAEGLLRRRHSSLEDQRNWIDALLQDLRHAAAPTPAGDDHGWDAAAPVGDADAARREPRDCTAAARRAALGASVPAPGGVLRRPGRSPTACRWATHRPGHGQATASRSTPERSSGWRALSPAHLRRPAASPMPPTPSASSRRPARHAQAR